MLGILIERCARVLHEAQLEFGDPDEWRTSLYGLGELAYQVSKEAGAELVPAPDLRPKGHQFMGMNLKVDNSMPRDEIRLYANGGIVGVITGLECEERT